MISIITIFLVNHAFKLPVFSLALCVVDIESVTLNGSYTASVPE